MLQDATHEVECTCAFCLQSPDKVFTGATTPDHPIPQTGSVLKSRRDKLIPQPPLTVVSRDQQNAERT